MSGSVPPRVRRAARLLSLIGVTLAAPAVAADPPPGAREYQRNCAVCHMGAPNFAPPLAKASVDGREDAVRQLILDGGARMPGFKYMLDAQQVDSIIAFIKAQEAPPKTISNPRANP